MRTFIVTAGMAFMLAFAPSVGAYTITKVEPPAPGEFHVDRESDPLTDETNVFIGVLNEDRTVNDSSFFMFRCMENRTAVQIAGDSYFFGVRDDRSRVTVRMGKEEPITSDWGLTVGNENPIITRSVAISFLRLLHRIDPDQIFFRVEGYKGRRYDSLFNVRGVRPHIEEIAETCNWNLD